MDTEEISIAAKAGGLLERIEGDLDFIEEGIMQQHFVTFYSPGTFFPEETTRPIESWDVDKAVDIARTITERHFAKPYGFRFTTRGRGENDLDSKVTHSSGIYYLGGKILTLADVEARDDPKEEILRSNMRCNNIEKVIQNDNSWRFIDQFHPDDTLLDVTL